MIRKFEIDDLQEVMRIWLESNIKAHHFINESYWKENYETVKEILPNATIFVYENNEKIEGFVGLADNYIAGIFVENEKQSKGIGKDLLDYVKEKYPSLSLKVYKNNIRAVQFYQRENFVVKEEQLDRNTNEVEYVMDWEL
ncbi:N-acetyltransferase [Saliterribacillus persicus]|uniref:Putative acetyltransferase n=1 Tax=Saliterribacillus persicus TaxID=930114 RepID=A0A368X7K9_9BACI|nr:N-acetyltransferase [Saliterribacillus persicus]RCW63943.1 putative acetyltransferase [Saliterribacillus persicus]